MCVWKRCEKFGIAGGVWFVGCVLCVESVEDGVWRMKSLEKMEATHPLCIPHSLRASFETRCRKGQTTHLACEWGKNDQRGKTRHGTRLLRYPPTLLAFSVTTFTNSMNKTSQVPDKCTFPRARWFDAASSPHPQPSKACYLHYRRGSIWESMYMEWSREVAIWIISSCSSFKLLMWLDVSGDKPASTCY